MRIYSEYLAKQLSGAALIAERKKQLKRISELRGGTDVLVYASDMGKPNVPAMIDHGDVLPISDQLAALSGNSIDLILQTRGGFAEVVELIVRLIRNKYNAGKFSIIVPGYAMSAGTIMAMAADEILMGRASSLGPIDPQMPWKGKAFSAHAFLEGFDAIKAEINKTGQLHKAYIPILQGISPGEIQSAQNAFDLSKRLVADWLVQYKFKNWTTHSSTGNPVTDPERKQRAEEIAEKLRDHGKWLSHGRSITMQDLQDMKLQVTDYAANADLADAIDRYSALLHITFETNIYKVYETIDAQIYRFVATPVNGPTAGQPFPAVPPQVKKAAGFVIDFKCTNCQADTKLQADLGTQRPLQGGVTRFPPTNQFTCPQCGTVHDVGVIRRQLELQTGKKIV